MSLRGGSGGGKALSGVGFFKVSNWRKRLRLTDGINLGEDLLSSSNKDTNGVLSAPNSISRLKRVMDDEDSISRQEGNRLRTLGQKERKKKRKD
jgi:hypothetical protein